MIDALRSRALLVLVCAAIGVGLAVAGTSVGATGPISTTSSDPAFVVSEQNVTFQHDGEQSTVVANVGDADRIEFEEVDDGKFRVATERSSPLTDAERETATAIARSNVSVQRAIDSLDDPELTVEPIRKLRTDDIQTANVTTTEEDDGEIVTNATAPTFAIESYDEEGMVAVDREPAYVENEAVVRITEANGETEYSVVVDLETETIVDGIDWERD